MKVVFLDMEILNETLLKKYGDYVNVDRAAERLSVKLVEQREEKLKKR